MLLRQLCSQLLLWLECIFVAATDEWEEMRHIEDQLTIQEVEKGWKVPESQDFVLVAPTWG